MITTIPNRVKFQKRAGLSGYIAELTAAFVCAALSIRPTVRHADYLGSWLKTLREDNRVIFRAASKASKAADLLLACAPQQGEASTPAETDL